MKRTIQEQERYLETVYRKRFRIWAMNMSSANYEKLVRAEVKHSAALRAYLVSIGQLKGKQ